MKIKKNILVAVFSALIYTVTIFVFIASLYIENQKGKSNSPEVFSSLIHKLNVTLRNENPESSSFKKNILSSDLIENFQSIKLFYNEKEVLNYPAEQAKQKAFTLLKKESVRSPEGKTLYIEASLYTIKPSVIFSRGRLAFIVIFAVTLCLIFHLMFFADKVLIAENKNTKTLFDDDIKENDALVNDKLDNLDKVSDLNEIDKKYESKLLNEDYESSFENNNFSFEKDLLQEEENPFVNNFSDIKENQAPYDNESKIKEDTLSDEEKVKEAEEDLFEEELIENNSEEKDSSSKEKESQGLFSPDTGFGWESYMLTRLDNELIRSASIEQDLSLYTIRIPSLDWKSQCGKKISEAILQTVKFNDLVFNYKEDGCCAIISELNINQALSKAQELLKNINQIIKDNNSNLKCAIGISARSLRLISGSRLFNESEQALFHAVEDEENPIVAFKADSEKYRNYLASKIK